MDPVGLGDRSPLGALHLERRTAMLRSVESLINYVLDAEDGEIGRCKDLLFDDRQWVTRYMIADTGKWLPGRKVLISPISLGEPDWLTQRFPVKMTKAQVENSPPLDADAPVSRKYERLYFDHHGWPYYWAGGDLWGALPYPPPTPIPLTDKGESLKEEKEKLEETHLRSFKEVKGYYIEAIDGEIGHAEDFIVDDTSWMFRYMVVDTRNWLPGRKVLISPAWIEAITWVENHVKVDLTVDAVKNSPEYDPSQPVNREHEVLLYDYYGRPKYWEEPPVP